MKRAELPHALDVPTTLVNLGVAERDDAGLIFNNAGVLVFAKHLKDIFRRTTVTCALFKGIDKVETLDRRDFNDDIVSSIDSAMTVLKQWIPVRYEMTGTPQRREIPQIPYDALREAVINAVTHRDYFQKGANVMIEMFDDRIEISNPGGLVKGLPPEEFGRRSLLRNPNIANLLHEIKYIEKMGSGIPKMRRLMNEAGLQPVEFTFDTFFSVVFRRPVPEVRATTDEALISMNLTSILMQGGVEGVNEGVNEGVKARLSGELAYILQIGSATRQILQRLFHVSVSTVDRDISLLRTLGIIRFEGVPKKGRYVLTENGRSELQRTEVPIRSTEKAILKAIEHSQVSFKLTRAEIETTVSAELEHIPRGARGSSQNMLRMLYNMLRRHSLATGIPQTKEEVLRAAVNAVREEDPEFTPEYDKDFFEC